jgi:hypothetical protein
MFRFPPRNSAPPTLAFGPHALPRALALLLARQAKLLDRPEAVTAELADLASQARDLLPHGAETAPSLAPRCRAALLEAASACQAARSRLKRLERLPPGSPEVQPAAFEALAALVSLGEATARLERLRDEMAAAVAWDALAQRAGGPASA